MQLISDVQSVQLIVGKCDQASYTHVKERKW